MKIILTGSSGFLGRIISTNFPKEEMITIGRSNSDILCDLSASIPHISICDIVIHAAGKAHSVPKTPSEKEAFFAVNVNGTKNLLRGLEEAPVLPKSFIFISSVSVYGLNSGHAVNEGHPLNAKDPYGLSKVHAEQLISEWCEKNGIICTILRLPLLVGTNPPGNLGAMIKAIKKGYYLNIAGGKARRSMVMAEDIAKVIPKLAEVGGIYNLTDGYHPSFEELSRHIAHELRKPIPKNIPAWIALFMAKIGNLMGKKFPFNSYKLSKITTDLTFDDSKAQQIFKWKPTPVLESFKIE